MPEVKPALNDNQAEAVALIEQKFWLHGSIPTNEYLSEQLNVGIPTLQRWWQNAIFRDALIRRGVDLRDNRSKNVLTPQQLQVVNLMLNQHDKRSQREKLAEAGITSQKYYSWLRQPAFLQYLQKRAEDLFASSDHEGYLALLDTVKGGDIQAIKLFFEMRGKYTPSAKIDINVETVMIQIVEIIGRHVKEPATLQAIADDIDNVIGIRKPQIALPVGSSNGDGGLDF